MANKLIQVAKELNVGVATMVEFLQNKGFEIDGRPNERISEEVETILYKEFQKSGDVKVKVDDMKIGRPYRREEDNTPKEVQPPNPISIRPNLDTNDTPEQIVQEEEVITAKQNTPILPKIKILDKIDINNRKKKPFPREEDAKQENGQHSENSANKNGRTQDTDTLPDVVAAEPITEITVSNPSQNETSPSESSTIAVSNGGPELIRAETPELRGLKIKGKIDIDKFNKKPKPREQESQDDRNQRNNQNQRGDRNNDNRNRGGNENRPNQDRDNRDRPNFNNRDNRDQRLGQDNRDRPNPNNNREQRDNRDRPNFNNRDNRDQRPGQDNRDRPNQENREPRPEQDNRDRPNQENRDQRPRQDNRDRPNFNNRDNRDQRPGQDNRDRPNPNNNREQRDNRDRPNFNNRDNRDQRPGQDNRDRPNQENRDRPNPNNNRDRPNPNNNRDNRDRPASDDRRDQRPRPPFDPNRPRPQQENNQNREQRNNGPIDESGLSEAEKARRKRKRMVVSGSPQEGEQQRSDTNRGDNNRTRTGDNRSRDARPDNRRPNEGGTGEVSKKEIDDKIRATMARLSGGGKKKRQKIRRENREGKRERQEQMDAENTNEKIQVTEFISVSELASLMNVSPSEVIMTCMNMGVFVSINQRLDAEIIELIIEEFGHEVEFISAEEQINEDVEIEDAPEDLLPRAPIVTVMGHVDHGKTSLLDYIRSAKVVEGEAGGITQHIGAYEVMVGEQKSRITFLDTPGHEAFTAMRARGAKVTDVAIIIIAADDSIMPQTKEAISHAQAAGVPLIFAINKVDKPDANPERIKQELASMNLLVEEWGGKYQSQDISAKTGLGIDELLEKVLLESEILELKANPNRKAVGTVLEASLDKGRGYVTKILIQKGTLSVGAPIIAGEYAGKVKAMFDERGNKVKKAGPSKPVLILGLNGAPQAGERFKEADNEADAKILASKRAQINREQVNRATKRISLDEIGRRLALGNFKELNLIVKGDFDGSIEALSDSLQKQSIESVQVNIIHKAVGQIIESDVLLASASDAIIIGFQVRPSVNARKLAEREGVEIKTYSIIYEAINELRAAIEGMLEPTKEENILGLVEIREVFKISKLGTVAGCYVQEGKITRNANIRVVREGIVVFPVKEGAVGKIASLRRFKEDMKEVKAGFECGLNVENFNDIKVGDVIEAYEIVEVKQKLG